MMPGSISKRIVSDRLAWIERMTSEIRALPLTDQDSFLADYRNVGTAESCLRRALEALFDLGSHILAKGFGSGVSEYKEIVMKSVRHSSQTWSALPRLAEIGSRGHPDDLDETL